MFLLHVKSFLITHPHPQRAKGEREREENEALQFSFILAGAEKQATVFCAKELQSDNPHVLSSCVRIVLVTVTVSLLWQAQRLVIFVYIMFYIHPSLSHTRNQLDTFRFDVHLIAAKY